MSRAIKVRLYSKPAKKYIDYITVGFLNTGELRNYSTENGFGPAFEDDYIVEQYTGIKDKDGKEIYEGDVIESWYLNGDGNGGYYDAGNFEVVFKNGAFGVTRKDEFYTFDEIEWDELKDIKVIGNIHKDKKLLGGKK